MGSEGVGLGWSRGVAQSMAKGSILVLLALSTCDGADEETSTAAAR